MRLYASDAGSVVRDLRSRQDITLLGGSTYLTYDLGQRSDNYNITLPYADGYYYARLQNLTDPKRHRA